MPIKENRFVFVKNRILKHHPVLQDAGKVLNWADRLPFWDYPLPHLLCGKTSGFFRESRVRWPPPHLPHPPLPAFSTPPLLLSLGVVQPLQLSKARAQPERRGWMSESGGGKRAFCWDFCEASTSAATEGERPKD